MNWFCFIALIFSSNIAYASNDFVLPLECKYGENCFIQNYVDLAEGEGEVLDYKCGEKSYDKHKGTDFLVTEYPQASYEVKAAGSGVVVGIRDGLRDYAFIDKDSSVDGRECGNGVVIQHKDAVTTTYCHLKNGSINFVKYDDVKQGDIIGLVGMSGKTEFPHLHFAIKEDGVVLDPFTGSKAEGFSCTKNPSLDKSLFKSDLLAKLFYQTGGIVELYVTDKIPNKTGSYKGLFKENIIENHSKYFITWLRLMGSKRGDKVVVETRDQVGQLIFQADGIIDKNYASYFQYFGKRLDKLQLSKGIYSSSAKLVRGGKVISKSEVLFTKK